MCDTPARRASWDPETPHREYRSSATPSTSTEQAHRARSARHNGGYDVLIRVTAENGVRISLGQLSIDGFDDDVLDQLSGSSTQEYVIIHNYRPRISRTKIQMIHSP